MTDVRRAAQAVADFFSRRWWTGAVAVGVGLVLIWGGIRQDDVLSCQRQNPVRDSARIFYLNDAAKNDRLAASFERTEDQSRKLLKVRKGVERQTVVVSIAESRARIDAYRVAARGGRRAAELPLHLDCGGLFPTAR